jgi:hypothetical protein
MILLKKDRFIQMISKDREADDFDFDVAALSQPISSLNDNINLRIEAKYLELFFTSLDWTAILHHSQTALSQAVVKTFFDSFSSSAFKLSDKYISFSVPFIHAKYFLDLLSSHLASPDHHSPAL